jgi:hypothetical protein
MPTWCRARHDAELRHVWDTVSVRGGTPSMPRRTLPLRVRLGDSAVSTRLSGVHLPQHDRCTGAAEPMARIARHRPLPPLAAEGPCTPGTDHLEVRLAGHGPARLLEHLVGRGDARPGVVDQDSTPLGVVASEWHRAPCSAASGVRDQSATTRRAGGLRIPP